MIILAWGLFALTFCTITASLWSEGLCTSVGFKRSDGVGFRLYLTRGDLVLARSSDLIFIYHGPHQGLFSNPPGHFSLGVETQLDSLAPNFGLMAGGGDYLFEWLALFGFKSGSVEPSFMGGGPIGGFNLPPTPTADMSSFAMPSWFPPLILAVILLIWAVRPRGWRMRGPGFEVVSSQLARPTHVS
jgi:hypothetical protein